MPNQEPNAAQGGFHPINAIKTAMSGGATLGKITSSGGAGVDVPHVKELTADIGSLNKAVTDLQTKINSFSSSHLVSEYGKISAAAKGASGGPGLAFSSPGTGPSAPAPSAPFGGSNNPVAQGRQGWTTASLAPKAAPTAGSTSAGSGTTMGGTSRAFTPQGGNGGSVAMSGGGGGGHSTMTGMGVAYNAGGGGSAGLIAAGLSGVMSGINKGAELLSSITQAGVQYTYNRLEGPTGNRNATMAMSQALAPLATTNGLSMDALIKGFAQRTPVQGSISDIMGTALAGNAVGAQLTGTPGRNGFFQGVREMQQLTPGIGAGQLAATSANYIGNTQSQQMGAFYGGGAFTSMGKGGRYKSLGEWAQGITEFFKQQRPGGSQGKDFTKAELMAQNFPGSNVNAWFQMMGVGQDMVDYWWQYVLTKAGSGATGKGPFDLQGAIRTQRGQDLGSQRLETITQSSRRDFLMGTQMYGQYGVKEEADKRFNVAMQKADLQIADMATHTNVGTIMSTLPTSVTDLLMPLLTKMAGSKAGALGTSVGMIEHLLGPSQWHATGDPPIGDPIGDTAGSYGAYGGTNTSHLSPDLAKKIAAAQRANPRLKVTSGYRDSHLNTRLNKKGVGRVGPSSKSKHTRGWAADLGPVSELGWLNANAHKFGLQTASNQGEPWHTQLAGTMPVGDPGGPIGDWWNTAKDAANTVLSGTTLGLSDMVQGNSPFSGLQSGVASGVASIFQGGGDIFGSLLTGFIGGNKGRSDAINNAIQLFIKTMLEPAIGLANVFGANSFSQGDVSSIIGAPTSIALDLPRYKGMGSDTNPSGGSTIFGDPMTRPSISSVGGGMPLNFRSPAMHGGGGASIRVDVQIPIVLQSSGNDTLDARRTAAVIQPHVQHAVEKAVLAAGGRG
jgi:hypothetical protein